MKTKYYVLDSGEILIMTTDLNFNSNGIRTEKFNSESELNSYIDRYLKNEPLIDELNIAIEKSNMIIINLFIRKNPHILGASTGFMQSKIYVKVDMSDKQAKLDYDDALTNLIDCENKFLESLDHQFVIKPSTIAFVKSIMEIHHTDEESTIIKKNISLRAVLDPKDSTGKYIVSPLVKLMQEVENV